MMGFLSPALLLLGLAIAVPLVLHLFQRQHGPRVEFPALRYLRRAEKEHARRIKLRQLLLLLLRVAALILLALAAARPFVQMSGDGHHPTAAVIVLDNSTSTGLVDGESRVFDELRARALETLTDAGPDDRFWLIRAAEPEAPAVGGSAEAMARLVEETQVVAGRATLGESIERARALLASGAEGRAREIHLLTDLQANELEAIPPAEEGDPALFVWAPRPTELTNQAIDAVEIGGGFTPRSGERSTVTVRVSGVDEGDTVQIRLALDDRVTAAADLTGEETVLLPFPARSAGYHAGWVEIDPDGLRDDDRRYFVAHVLPPPRVSVSTATPFVDEALDVLADAGRIRRAEGDEAEIIVAPGAEGLGPGTGGRTTIVLPPATSLELPAANRRLAAAQVPWRYVPSVMTGEARLALDDHENDPLLSALSTSRIHEVYTLDRQSRLSGDSVLIRLDDGAPWLVHGTQPGGEEYLIIGSPLSEEASTLPTSSAMIPLLDRMIGTWAATEAERTAFEPGEQTTLDPEATAVERPDGVREDVEPNVPYHAAPVIGIHRVYSGDRVIGSFAVNTPASESDLTRLDGSRLRAAFGDWQPTIVHDANAWAGTVYHERLGREAWRPLVFLLLAFLLFETLVAAASTSNEGERRVDPNDARPVGAGANDIEPQSS